VAVAAVVDAPPGVVLEAGEKEVASARDGDQARVGSRWACEVEYGKADGMPVDKDAEEAAG
jgi:hypothetical protein